MKSTCERVKAFTLIELSIVLVVIGLLAGGVLVGRDLLAASAIRAQISQIEKYQTAVNTFKAKYNYLPGDIPDPDATNFGLVARGRYAGEGDGNGVLEGNASNTTAQTASTPTQVGIIEMSGETTVFWVDLSTAGLIDGSFNTATHTGAYRGAGNPITGSAIDLYLPSAKIGAGNYLYVWSGGCCQYISGARPLGDGSNWFGLSAVTAVGYGGSNAGLNSGANITVLSASAIDSKIDDGLPLNGRVIGIYNGCSASTLGYAMGGTGDAQANCGALPAAKWASSATCYDNGNVSGATFQYSLRVNNGSGTNCALSFKFQ